MQFRNTPMQDCRRSPAQMVFGRAMRDFIPSLPHKYEPAKDWVVTQEYRERTLALKREADHEKWSQRTRDLDMLEVGTPVIIQNQTGINPTKWDKTGVVLENKPHSQVLVRVDGSRRVTLRNRRFIRELNPSLARLTPEPVRKTPRKRKMPEAIPTGPESQAGRTPACTAPEVPQPPSPAGVQPRAPSPAAPQPQDPIPTAPETQAGRTPACTVPEPIQDPAPPPLYTPYQALEGMNERLDNGVETDDVVIEMTPNQPTQNVDEPPNPNMGRTRPRRTVKPNPK